MIPLKLQLKNFLSYGSDLQTIDFGNYNLICLSGKNGHGKSALLDAMTWAIWGQARKANGTTKADLGLIRIGQRQMSVIFDFIFNEEHYRIRREISTLYNKNTASLDFGIIKPEGVISLTDKTIKATQDAIVKLVGLDFDAFANSSFLRQGGSNEFSKKSPKERKDILASILSLERYDQLRDLSLEKARKLEQNLSVLEQLVIRFDTELESLNSFKNREDLLKERAALDTQETDLRKDVLELDKLEKSVTNELKQAEVTSKNKSMLDAAQNMVTEQLNSVRKTFAQSQKELISLPKKLENFSRFKEDFLKQEKEYQVVTVLEEDLKKLLDNNIQFKSQRSTLQAQLELLTKQKLELGDQVIIIDNNESKIRLKNSLQKHTQKLSGWRQQYNSLEKEIVNLEKQFNLLSINQANCLVCEQKLEPDQKNIIIDKIEHKKIFISSRLTRLKSWSLILEQKISSETKQIDSLELEISKNNLELANNKKRDSLDLEINKVTLELKNSDSKNSDLEVKVKKLQQQIDAFDKNYFKEQEKKYRLLSEQQSMIEKRLIFKQMQEERLKRFADLKKQYKHIQLQLKSLPVIDINYLQEQEKKLQQKKSELTLRLQNLRLAYEKIAQELGKIEHAEQQAASLAKEKESTLAKINILNQDIRDYRNIAQMMSKDGLQALLIEEAIPELEYEANQLLAKLTDNQCHIMIDSLKDLKKGGTKETLDIKISDAVGIRPYEMFSGGEAFRIDFSLRIALSKLLSRRAGTSLQTLIIDEGFGSQDDDGLNHIMDALHRVQDDFAKIIIVSHLPGMKEQFPVHFMIEKGPAGSLVRVVEQS